METKKSVHVDLEKKSSFFFSLGLLIAMALMVMAFEWKQQESGIIDLIGKSTNTSEAIMIIPPTEILPPSPPKIQSPAIEEVPDETKIKDEIVILIDTEFTGDTKMADAYLIPDPIEEIEETFIFVEEPAAPKGGMPAFYKYIGDKMKYPAQARRMGIEGKVFVEFVIGKDGSISEVRSVKGIGAGCDEEAIRVIQAAPIWTPGKQRGKSVKQRMILPITFKLG